jgi:hypothetical protein
MSTNNQLPSFNEDSLDSKISRLLTLQELDAEDRAGFRKEVREQLEVLDQKISYTNGRVASTLKDLEEMKTKNKEDEGMMAEIKELVFWKTVAIKLLGSKLFWIFVALMAIGALVVFTDVKPQEVIPLLKH